MRERLTDALIRELNGACSGLRACGECPGVCDSIGWCSDAWGACNVCPRLGAGVANGARAALDAVDWVLAKFYFKDNFPVDDAGEYLSDLETLYDEMEKVADWVVVDWHDGNASAMSLERDLKMVSDMCLDAYVHAHPESKDDSRRLPRYLGKHGEWLKAVKSDLSRAVSPGSLGVPRACGLDREGV